MFYLIGFEKIDVDGQKSKLTNYPFLDLIILYMALKSSLNEVFFVFKFKE